MSVDPLFPVAASVVTKDLKSRQNRLAAVASAALIQGPLAMVPALLFLKRARDAREVVPQAGRARQRVHPPLVTVPNVVGQPADGATRTLRDLKLDPQVTLHESDEQHKGNVQAQDPAHPLQVEQTTKVALRVGAGPAESGAENDASASSMERTNQLLAHMDQTLTEMKTKLAEG